MVFESIISPYGAEKRPWLLFFLGAFIASIALILSLWVFEEHAGLVMVFLTVIGSLPLFYHTMRYEEHEGLVIKSEKGLLFHHGKALMFFMFYFIGITAALTAWYVALPEATSTMLFSPQVSTITGLNQQVTGNTIGALAGKSIEALTGNIASTELMTKIFLNNVKVMIFCIIFSFFYGSGAIFILTWNSSVIAAALGNFVRTRLAMAAAETGLISAGGYFHVIGLSLLRYSIHGIPEILAYFVAGLGGGILSVAIIRKDYKGEAFERLLLDVSDLVMISVFILFVASLLEVYVTPIFFG